MNDLESIALSVNPESRLFSDLKAISQSKNLPSSAIH